MPYLTPLPTPAIDAGCRRLFVPADYFPIVLGALLELTDLMNWEQDGGQDTVQEAVDKMVLMLEEVEECGNVIGQILTLATADIPSNALECDGAGYLREDYPELYAVIGSEWIVDADNFVVPDLRGRAMIGAGEGAGLTPRSLGDGGGEEEITLIEHEMPTHKHEVLINCVSTNADTIDPEGNLWAQIIAGSHYIYSTQRQDAMMDINAAAVGNKGGGFGHENMQPFAALTMAIVATNG